MINSSNLRIEFSRDGIHNRVVIKCDFPKDSKLSYCWFVIMESELRSFAKSYGETICDGCHRLQVNFDSIVLYDFDAFPSKNYGEFNIPYYSMTFPHFARKLIVKYAKRLFKTMSNGEQKTLEITPTTVNRWNRLYGQSLGKVEVVKSDGVEELLQKNNSKQLKQKLIQIGKIARNSTYMAFQTAQVKLYKDSGDFYWEAYSPSGKRIMNGGLINHGRGGSSPDWSIHT